MSDMQTIGWDIGGAHIKCVVVNAQGELVNALQVPCPLWKGLDYLTRAISHALEALQILPSSAYHAITMTGELVDFFPNRHTGVLQIAATLNRLLCADRQRILFYAAHHGFVRFEKVSSFAKHIASANWHASASLLAKLAKNALLVDIGSTTTDIIPIQSGKVHTLSITDADRMQTDQLIYTGVIRTPVMSLGNKLICNGVETNIAAEYFATMADVYRLTGELSQDTDMADTADGQGKSLFESARRLARMVGHDAEDKHLTDWKELALVCKNMQVAQIKSAILKHLKPNAAIIGAGAGAFLVASIAEDLACAYLPVSQMLEENMLDIQLLEVCFPAYAVANLSVNQLQVTKKIHA